MQAAVDGQAEQAGPAGQAPRNQEMVVHEA
jgi:hypothetical protein